MVTIFRQCHSSCAGRLPISLGNITMYPAENATTPNSLRPQPDTRQRVLAKRKALNYPLNAASHSRHHHSMPTRHVVRSAVTTPHAISSPEALPGTVTANVVPTVTERLFPVGQILRLHALMDLLGLSKSTIYDRMNPRSPRYDPTFPRCLKLGRSAVGWQAAEVLDWIRAQAATRSM